jgi:hypothetical protein
LERRAAWIAEAPMLPVAPTIRTVCISSVVVIMVKEWLGVSVLLLLYHRNSCVLQHLEHGKVVSLDIYRAFIF